MSTELKAGDTITAESLNGIAEGAYTFKSGEILTASKLNTIAEAIEDKDEEIAELQAQVEELQEELANVPIVEALNVTANGTYSEEGKAYSPVEVSVSSVAVEALNVTQNGTYSEEGKAYSPVTVNVPALAEPNNIINLSLIVPSDFTFYYPEIELSSKKGIKTLTVYKHTGGGTISTALQRNSNGAIARRFMFYTEETNITVTTSSSGVSAQQWAAGTGTQFGLQLSSNIDMGTSTYYLSITVTRNS